MRVVLTCLLVLAAPASASAATLDKTGPTLTYTAGAGRANQPVFASPAGQPGTVTVTDDVNDPIQATGCTPIAGGYSCPGIQLVVVNAGDGDDVVQAAGLGTAAQLNGGAGDDQLFAGAGADSLGGGDGDDLLEGGGGNDILDGGGDDDQLDGGTGTDKLIGGTGIDLGAYDAVAATPAPAISLDGVANDGVPGENDDFEADIEDVSVSGVGPASSTVIGSAAPNTLTTGAGNDTIVGGAGADNITSGAGDDTIDARDGAADRVRCGAGTDVVSADTLDLVSSSCETVNVADVPNAADDRPPAIAWMSPRSRATLGAATTLTASASDDRGIALVRFLDDETVICEDHTAPYTCDYRPRGADIGRDTLTAIAIDTGAQTAAVQRAVTVGKFKPTIDLSVRPRDSTYTAGGNVGVPANLTRKQGCTGIVTLRVKSRGQTVFSRKGKLTSRCTYSIRNLRLRAGRFRFVATYNGNRYLRARTSKTVTATKR